MRRSLLFLLLLAAHALAAQDLAQFEKILLPSFRVEPILGMGALFTTQLYAVSEREFRYFPAPGPFGRPDFRVQPARDPFFSFFAVPRETRGLLLFIDRAVSAEVGLAYELHISSTTPTGASHLTPLPAPRESQFLRGAARIIGVPARGTAERNHLRIYDVDITGTLRVRVRVVAIWPSPGTEIEDRIVDVDSRDGGEIVHPFYKEILLPTCVPDPPRECGNARVSVELLPLDESRYYAFVSSTDNVTQEVRVFTAAADF